MRCITGGRMAAFGALSALALLSACGSSERVVVVPQAQPTPAPSTTIVQQPGTTVLPPGARVVCADGRSPPCP
jgi:hypothetical protein